VARSVPGGLAREGRPVAARYLFNLGEPVTTGDAELVTGGMEQSRTIPRPLVGRCDWWWRDKVMADFLFSIW